MVCKLASRHVAGNETFPEVKEQVVQLLSVLFGVAVNLNFRAAQADTFEEVGVLNRDLDHAGSVEE